MVDRIDETRHHGFSTWINRALCLTASCDFNLSAPDSFKIIATEEEVFPWSANFERKYSRNTASDTSEQLLPSFKHLPPPPPGVSFRCPLLLFPTFSLVFFFLVFLRGSTAFPVPFFLLLSQPHLQHFHLASSLRFGGLLFCSLKFVLFLSLLSQGQLLSGLF